jgi:hypothetical protein
MAMEPGSLMDAHAPDRPRRCSGPPRGATRPRYPRDSPSTPDHQGREQRGTQDTHADRRGEPTGPRLPRRADLRRTPHLMHHPGREPRRQFHRRPIVAEQVSQGLHSGIHRRLIVASRHVGKNGGADGRVKDPSVREFPEAQRPARCHGKLLSARGEMVATPRSSRSGVTPGTRRTRLAEALGDSTKGVRTIRSAVTPGTYRTRLALALGDSTSTPRSMRSGSPDAGAALTPGDAWTAINRARVRTTTEVFMVRVSGFDGYRAPSRCLSPSRTRPTPKPRKKTSPELHLFRPP